MSGGSPTHVANSRMPECHNSFRWQGWKEEEARPRRIFRNSTYRQKTVWKTPQSEDSGW